MALSSTDVLCIQGSTENQFYQVDSLSKYYNYNYNQINKLCGFIQLASVTFTTKNMNTNEKIKVDAACVLKDWDQEFTPQSLILIPCLITDRSSSRLGPPAKAALPRAL